MAALSPSKNAPVADIVYTPRTLAKEIIDHFSPSGIILDPCRGGGAFYDQFPDNLERHWCEINQGVDFESFDQRVDWIITNPPWSKMRWFITKGCSVSDNVVYLCTLTHFVTKARLRDLKQLDYGLKEFYCVPTPKKDWPASGFQLGAMHIEKGYRGPMMITGNVG